MTSEGVLGVIPARGGSKGIPRKNVRELAGKPLLAHTISAALKADSIGRIIVSTDDDEIRETSLEYGADAPFLRPSELATDEAPTEPVIEHALNYLSVEEGEEWRDVMVLQPTSPLRNETHIDEAVGVYLAEDSDSLVSVYEDHSYRWREKNNGAERLNYGSGRSTRQEKEPEYVENGAIYLTRSEELLRTDSLLPGRTALYVMSETDSIDIDEPFDLWLAEKILKEWKE